MITILGRPSSINVRKVLWTCSELGLLFQHEECDIDLTASTPMQSGFVFTELNPNAMVPVLLDNEFVLWESNTIIRYLANRYGDGSLYPHAAEARARVDQWLDWQASELNRAWSYAFMSLVRRSPEHDDTSQVLKSIQNWSRFMCILDERLKQTGAYVSGCEFSLADVSIGLSVHRWFGTPLAHPQLDAVQDYYQRITKRPGFLNYCIGTP
ncbi:glutathione S-transferase [Pluralibacter gergoviae]|uniref:glutathione S-transferase family protein n=1 Tax=Pluralibacter gergoviae TaxID=61647 RepID=UPI0009081BD8|nr:glutathione S-transferase N-terminal domain-containing protein [Pluralibacter gergoviae]OUR02899.1 glutathione S-transferase [Pluralibacter gergoviae]